MVGNLHSENLDRLGYSSLIHPRSWDSVIILGEKTAVFESCRNLAILFISSPQATLISIVDDITHQYPHVSRQVGLPLFPWDCSDRVFWPPTEIILSEV
jgi:hypothetical protein